MSTIRPTWTAAGVSSGADGWRLGDGVDLDGVAHDVDVLPSSGDPPPRRSPDARRRGELRMAAARVVREKTAGKGLGTLYEQKREDRFKDERYYRLWKMSTRLAEYDEFELYILHNYGQKVDNSTTIGMITAPPRAADDAISNRMTTLNEALRAMKDHCQLQGIKSGESYLKKVADDDRDIIKGAWPVYDDKVARKLRGIALLMDVPEIKNADPPIPSATPIKYMVTTITGMYANILHDYIPTPLDWNVLAAKAEYDTVRMAVNDGWYLRFAVFLSRYKGSDSNLPHLGHILTCLKRMCNIQQAGTTRRRTPHNVFDIKEKDLDIFEYDEISMDNVRQFTLMFRLGIAHTSLPQDMAAYRTTLTRDDRMDLIYFFNDTYRLVEYYIDHMRDIDDAYTEASDIVDGGVPGDGDDPDGDGAADGKVGAGAERPPPPPLPAAGDSSVGVRAGAGDGGTDDGADAGGPAARGAPPARARTPPPPPPPPSSSPPIPQFLDWNALVRTYSNSSIDTDMDMRLAAYIMQVHMQSPLHFPCTHSDIVHMSTVCGNSPLLLTINDMGAVSFYEYDRLKLLTEMGMGLHHHGSDIFGKLAHSDDEDALRNFIELCGTFKTAFETVSDEYDSMYTVLTRNIFRTLHIRTGDWSSITDDMISQISRKTIPYFQRYPSAFDAFHTLTRLFQLPEGSPYLALMHTKYSDIVSSQVIRSFMAAKVFAMNTVKETHKMIEDLADDADQRTCVQQLRAFASAYFMYGPIVLHLHKLAETIYADADVHALEPPPPPAKPARIEPERTGDPKTPPGGRKDAPAPWPTHPHSTRGASEETRDTHPHVRRHPPPPPPPLPSTERSTPGADEGGASRHLPRRPEWGGDRVRDAEHGGMPHRRRDDSVGELGPEDLGPPRGREEGGGGGEWGPEDLGPPRRREEGGGGGEWAADEMGPARGRREFGRRRERPSGATVHARRGGSGQDGESTETYHSARGGESGQYDTSFDDSTRGGESGQYDTSFDDARHGRRRRYGVEEELFETESELEINYDKFNPPNTLEEWAHEYNFMARMQHATLLKIVKHIRKEEEMLKEMDDLDDEINEYKRWTSQAMVRQEELVSYGERMQALALQYYRLGRPFEEFFGADYEPAAPKHPLSTTGAPRVLASM